MRILGSSLIVFLAAVLALPASANSHTLAGAPSMHQSHYAPMRHHKKRMKTHRMHPKKYTVENGVKVYRNQPSAQRQKMINMKRLHIADTRARQHRREIKMDLQRKKQQKARKAAFKDGYDRGYQVGYQKARHQQRSECTTCYRRRVRLRQRIRTRPRVSNDVIRRRNLQ